MKVTWGDQIPTVSPRVHNDCSYLMYAPRVKTQVISRVRIVDVAKLVRDNDLAKEIFLK